jgi:hypothetical protein
MPRWAISRAGEKITERAGLTGIVTLGDGGNFGGNYRKYISVYRFISILYVYYSVELGQSHIQRSPEASKLPLQKPLAEFSPVALRSKTAAACRFASLHMLLRQYAAHPDGSPDIIHIKIS